MKFKKMDQVDQALYGSSGEGYIARGACLVNRVKYNAVVIVDSQGVTIVGDDWDGIPAMIMRLEVHPIKAALALARLLGSRRFLTLRILSALGFVEIR